MSKLHISISIIHHIFKAPNVQRILTIKEKKYK